jgi:hypothetical protein
MDALNEVLQFLDRHTNFVRDLNDMVQSPQWPTGWLTSHQFAQEVDRFQFWAGVRSRVPQQTRSQLIAYYLKRAADDDSSGWVRIDDQFKLNPDKADIDNGKAVDSKASQRRRHGRVTCEMLSCQLGEVVNLSASGVMIRGKGQPQHKADDRVHLDLKCLDHELNATARVAWVRPSDRRFEMGLEFIDLTADQAQRIRELLPIAAAVQTVGEAGVAVTHYGR